jgi:hypothetical protein
MALEIHANLWRSTNFSFFVFPVENAMWGRMVYPKVSRLAAWSENCKWYSSLPLGAVVSLFRKYGKYYRHNPLCCFSTIVYCCKHIFRYWLSPETFVYTIIYYIRFPSCHVQSPIGCTSRVNRSLWLNHFILSTQHRLRQNFQILFICAWPLHMFKGLFI